MKYSNKSRRRIAMILLAIMSAETILPNRALALTTGPSQPEVQGFEPVGTTDMVDMFSGDFVYNIPLMDVEGYPVNISYHGGVSMEQEASWVGLGWNINPGEVNRSVRGLPDDFKGDTLSKELHIKDDRTLRVGIGAGVELAGLGDPLLGISASLGANVTFNNYRGTSCDYNLGAGINVLRTASVGVNIGIGSQTGAEIDYNANISVPSAQTISKDMSGGIGFGVSQGYSSRTGLTDRCLSYSINVGAGGNSSSHTSTNNIPIGVKNFVPVITNSTTMKSFSGRVKFGGELAWCLGYVTANGLYSKVHYNNDGSKDAYGYMYMQHANPVNNYSILDFTRDKDGSFNKTMQYLPPANMTYDIFSVSGQGTGGMFRPYRNDFGSVYDPVTKSTESSHSAGLEAGAGWIFEIGGDYTDSRTKIESGPWNTYMRSYVKRTSGSLYEDVFLKQGGELTSVNPQYFGDIHGTTAMDPGAASGLPATKAGSAQKRDARGNLVYYFTADELSKPGIGYNPHIWSYSSTNGFADGPDASRTEIARIGTNRLKHKKAEIGEVVQVQNDGRKYIYGIPALNRIQKEATFAVDPPSSTDMAKGLVSYSSGDASVSNGKGIDNYYASTATPSYAHSFLLTSVLSSDYVDVTGDGVTDDDLGSYTKMNYTLRDTDYRWKAPFDAGKAQYLPGNLSDKRDDKGSIVIGSREQWYLHSIETRNFVAEFYTSQRNDGCGVGDAIVSSGQYAIAPYNSSTTPGSSYKLDSIKLFNKHDRFINKTSAIPIKTVYLVYSDTLCRGIPNVHSGSGTAGKLTLNRIYVKYGNSEKSMISPYEFSYGYNPRYDLSKKDRWGSYKAEDSTITNFEFPFVNQKDPLNDTYASAWSLTRISLPSGGVIQAEYESDDYSYVQDKAPNEMFILKGIGNGPGFNPSSFLYANESSPYLFMYFDRETTENAGLSFRDNYLKGQSIMYYNVNVKLNDARESSYEQIKGYANIDDIGPCPDGIHGYIKLRPVAPAGEDDMNVNPVTFTAINTGRYSLPHILYPGTPTDPDESFAVLDGLKAAFKELVSLYKNPVVQMIKRMHNARVVNLKKSYVRLQRPGLTKKGGGQRVRSLSFFDNWNALAGGNEQDATYGKYYIYETTDPVYGTISSGVASYEPMIGGDENPFRQPVPYIVQTGSNFPPSDPIDLYQEMPIGESLYPPAVVGYSKVATRSIHGPDGISSQGIDVYQFYTSKDFPIRFEATAIKSSFTHHFDFFNQDNEMTATQGYSLIFNDMHGKPRSIEHYVYHPGSTSQMISYQTYNYHMSGGQLDNNVNCLVYDTASTRMAVRNMQLGVESDVTIDTRRRDEETKTNTANGNLNLSGVFLFIFPIVLAYDWEGNYSNNFKSASVTKVTQQYGILDNVQSYNEGAITTVRNELFDPETGQVVVTSVNNEYQDREYSVTIPAWWGYIGMGPSYSNIKYETDLPPIEVLPTNMGRFLGAAHFNVGDQLYMTYKDGSGIDRETTAWFMSSQKVFTMECQDCCYGFILPRFPTATGGWVSGATLTDVHVQVISAGAKNMLNQTIESYTTKGSPLEVAGAGQQLKIAFDSLISISARTYSDSNTKLIPHYVSVTDTINPYAMGQRGLYRLTSEYAYVKDRNYGGLSSRESGVFSGAPYFSYSGYDPSQCVQFPYNYISPGVDPNWYRARTVTKWSPTGQELENLDAVGNYSSAIFGYNDDLPVATISNAQQGEALAEGFEDYAVLRYSHSIIPYKYSPYASYFDSLSLSPVSAIYCQTKLDNASDLDIVRGIAHTGKYALSVPVTSGSISGIYGMDIPTTNAFSGGSNIYNTYFPLSYGLGRNDEYSPFRLTASRNYILSFWVRKPAAGNISSYTLHDSCGISVDGTFYKPVKKTNIIEGWQQMEVKFKVPLLVSSVKFRMPVNYYLDDIRFFPDDANMKSYVYHPVNERLMATLDENNFASFYEYDQEGTLVRVKRETEKGIMTVSESRNNNPLKQ